MGKFLKCVLPMMMLVSMFLTLWLQPGIIEAASLSNSQWCIVRSPNNGTQGDFLYSVATVSSSDIWAVGYYVNKVGQQRALIEHSNGTSWSIVKGVQANGGHLNAVSAVSSNNIWAVGSYYVGNVIQTLVEHWDGNTWRLVPSPNPPSSPESMLLGVAVVSSNDIWAVGFYDAGSKLFQSLTETYC